MRPLLVVPIVAAGACGGAKQASVPDATVVIDAALPPLPDAAPPPPDAAPPPIDAAPWPDAPPSPVAGIWQVTSGNLMTGIATLQFLVLGRDGGGAIYSESSTLHVKGTLPIVYGVPDGQTLTIWIQNLDTSSTFSYALPDPDTLVLTDSSSAVTTFARATTVGSAAPVDLGATTAIPLSNAQHPYLNALAGDDTGLWWTLEDDLTPLHFVPDDPTSSTTGAFSASDVEYHIVVGVQDGDFWLDCNCGGNTVLDRWTQSGTLVTEIDLSAAPISTKVSTQSVAWDGSHLWVLGFDYTLSRMHLLELDVSSTPATLVADLPASDEAYVQSVVFRAGHLWSVVSFLVQEEIVELDPATGDAIETYASPAFLQLQETMLGLAVENNTLYTFGALPTHTDLLQLGL
jgi:hypothetical protein